MTYRNKRYSYRPEDSTLGVPHRHVAQRPMLSRRTLLMLSAVGVAETLVGKVERAFGKQPNRPVPAPQAETKRVYLAPDDHTDYMWTADEAAYRTAFIEMLDYYLDLADASIAANELPEYQSRWNTDGTLWLWEYQKNKTATQFDRLMNRVKSGHISVPLHPLCLVLGGAPAEAVLRSMYYAGRLERQYAVKFSLAVLMENATAPYGVGALFAGAGAKYSWKGVCGCTSKLTPADLANREHEIYWWVGPDGSRLLMKWYSFVNYYFIGGYAEARSYSSAVDYVSTDQSFLARHPYSVAGAFGQGGDDPKTQNANLVAGAKAKTTTDRKVIVSNETDFFQDFETTHGSSLPSLSVTYGNEWELGAASVAEVAARNKRAVEKLRAAEALATLVSLKNASFMNGRNAARDQAFMNLGLFWEHCWTFDGAITKTDRANWLKRMAGEVESYVNTLHSDVASALGGLITKTGSNSRFFVFNALGWARTDFADFSYTGATPVHVVDVSTSQEVPSQIVTVNAQKYIRILASGVPSVGYKVFEVRSGSGTANWSAGAPSASGSTIENSNYKLTVANRGAITSLLDKTRSNREFVRGALNDLNTNTGALSIEDAGVVSVTLKADVTSGVKRTTRITLYRGLDRIDIRNDITQNFSTVESWRFGFELNSPNLWHEEVGAIIRARLTPDGHYATRNARYDWLTLNHFADMQGSENVGMTLSNADCLFMQLGNSTVSTLDINTPQLTVLAGGKVDGYGADAQAGDAYFLQRFALRAHDAYDPTAAMKLALEHQNPLVTGAITGGTDYPETSFSLINFSNSNVLLWALKPAEDGIAQGVMARVWNMASAQAACAISVPAGSVQTAKHVSHIETPIANLAVAGGGLNDTLAAQQIKSYQLTMALGSSTPVPTPTQTFVPLVTNTPTRTSTPNNPTVPATPTQPGTPSLTATQTKTPTPTSTPTLPGTPKPTLTPTRTITGTRPTPRPTPKPTSTSDGTPTATPTDLPASFNQRMYLPLALTGDE